MIFSENWLREFVDPGMSTELLVETLTMAGLEVDSVSAAAARFSGVVVGSVVSVEKHPDADKLSVCQVSDGTEHYQVVCGAPNVRAGLVVPFARVGAILEGGEKPFKIKAAKLRGVESAGMLCSAEELGLAEASEGLLELPATLEIGCDIRLALDLDDQLIELDLTPNRGDCLGMLGLAREVGVLASASVAGLDFTPSQVGSERRIAVATDAPDACPKYLGRVIEGIDLSVGSPFWLQERLRRSGIRSIDPVVDITNLMLLELGQPMHAFDADALQGSVRARMAEAGERMTLLDGREVELDSQTLLIADDVQPLAMAGVMGGLSSAVSAKTSSIFLECAFFSQLAIAGKARSYGLHTDASHRYERGVDYELQESALERATSLLVAIVGGQPGPVSAAYGSMPEEKQVTLRFSNVERLLGVRVASEQCLDILGRLGFERIAGSDHEATFRIPSFRFDCAIEADLIEEIARVYGYNQLPQTPPRSADRLPRISEALLPLSDLKRQLVAEGFQEAINYSFIEPDLASTLCPDAELIALQNPISTELSVMRPSILPGLIANLVYNLNRQRDRVRLFETGLVFERIERETVQTRALGGLLYGACRAQSWNSNKRTVDFFGAKGIVEQLLSSRGDVSRAEFVASTHPALHPGQCAEIFDGGRSIGFVGALHPRLQRHFDLAQPAFLFELQVAPLLARAIPAAQPLSRYPEVSRDLAIVVSEELASAAIEKSVRGQCGEHLVDLTLFDVYAGENIGAGKKSIALGLTWQHPSRTLGDEEISGIIANCINALAAEFNAELRI